MNDSNTGATPAPIAIALVHGIGAVHPQDMIRDVTKALEPSLSGTEFHPWVKVIDTPEGIEICQREARSGQPITVASAYWGDICQVGEGVLSVLGGLLTNIFGLRFFASAAMRGGGPLRHPLWLANTLIVWVAAIVTYPLNIVTMLYSTFLLAGHYISSGYASATSTAAVVDLAYPAALAAAATVFLGCGLLLRKLWPKRFEGGVYIPLLVTQMFFGLAAIVLLTAAQFNIGDIASDIRTLMGRYGASVDDPRWIDLAASRDPRIFHISVLGFLQVMAGILVVLLAMLALPLTLLNFAFSGFNAKVGRATFLALSASVAGWLFVLMITWPENIVTNLAISTVSRPTAYRAHWIEALLLSFVVLLALTALSIVLLRRHSGGRSSGLDLAVYAPSGHGSEPSHRVGPRLIFSPLIQLVLAALLAIAVAISLSHALKWQLVPQFIPVQETWINLAAMGVIVLFVMAAPLFRYGAKTLMDIVDHFSFPSRGYPVRKRISQRFRSVVRHLVEQSAEKPDLVVVSHSQGTVVSLDALHDPEFQSWLAPRVRSLTLLTFGSPYEHVYRHYFHGDYPGELPGDFEKFAASVKFRWSNIYRCDDYVGTFVRGGSSWSAENVPLGVGGHVDYWRPEVFAQLMREGRILPQRAVAAANA